MANLKQIIYLSQEDYDTLVDNNSITKNNKTLYYDLNTLYITPEKITANDITGLIPTNKLEGILEVANGGTGSATAGVNTVFAGPSFGIGNAAPNFRSLVSADIPTLSITDKTSGTLPVDRGGTGVTAIADIQAGKDGDGNTISSTYLKLSGGTLTGDLGILTGDSDKFLNFWYNVNKTAGGSWRLGALGSGSNDTNYFIIQSGTSTTSATTWNDVIRIGQNTYDVAFGGNIYPLTNNAKTLGTSLNKWSNVYSTTFTGDLTGNVTGNVTGSSGSCTGNAATATKATQDADGNTITSTYLKLSGGTMTGNLFVGTTSDTVQRRIGAVSGAGHIFFYSDGTSGGNRGIWINNGSDEKNAMFVDSNNNVTLNGHASSDLPLTGGTLTGQLTVPEKLTVKNNTATQDIELYANNDGTSGLYIYKPNGGNYNKTILGIDSNGSVTLYGHATSDLPLTGGTLTGTLAVRNNVLAQKSDGNYNIQLFCNEDNTMGIWAKQSTNFNKCFFRINSDASIYLGSNTFVGEYVNDTVQRQLGAASGAGNIFFYVDGAHDGHRGIWTSDADLSGPNSKNVISIDWNNNITLNGHATSDLALTGGTLTGTLRLNVSGDVNWFESMTDSTHIGGAILMVKSDRRWRFRQMKTPLTSEEGAIEDYILPAPTASSYTTYNILTTKSNGSIPGSIDGMYGRDYAGYWELNTTPSGTLPSGVSGYTGLIIYYFRTINITYQIYIEFSGGVKSRHERRYNGTSWSSWKKVNFT